MKTAISLLCLLAALAPYGAEALNCKSCMYAEVDGEAVDADTLNGVLDDMDLEVKCKNPSSLPSDQCGEDSQCVLLEFSGTVDTSDDDSVSLEGVYRNCYVGDEEEGCGDIRGNTTLPGDAGDLVTILEVAGYDVTDLGGRVCYCNQNNCNKDADDEGGATGVGVTLMTLVAAVVTGQVFSEF